MTETEDTDRPNDIAEAGCQPALTEERLNSLIRPSEADASLEPGKALPSDGKPNKLDLAYVDKALAEHYSHWAEGAGEARERLYRLLGRIYEWGPELKSDPTLEAAVIALIKKRHKVKVQSGKTGDELLLMLAVGFGKTVNVTRCQWLRALRAAEQSGVRRNAFSLAEWVRDNDGVMAAGAHYKPEGSTGPTHFHADEYIGELASGSAQVVEWPLPEIVPEEGDHLLIVRRGSSGSQIKVLGSVSSPDAVTMVAKCHQAEAKRVANLLWCLNRYALKEAGNRLPGKKSCSDLKAFASALGELLNDPALKRRFFEDDAVPLQISPHPLASDSFPVINPSFNVNDPARYINGAKEGVLVPYSPDRKPWGELSALEQAMSASRVYMNEHLKKKVPDENDPEFQKVIAELRRRDAEPGRRRLEASSVKRLEDA